MNHVPSWDCGVTLCTHLITTETCPQRSIAISPLRQGSLFFSLTASRRLPSRLTYAVPKSNSTEACIVTCSTLRRYLPKNVALTVIMGHRNSSRLSRRRLLEGAASWAALALVQGCGYTSNYIYHPPTGSPLPVISGPVAQASLTVTAISLRDNSAAVHGFEL